MVTGKLWTLPTSFMPVCLGALVGFATSRLRTISSATPFAGRVLFAQATSKPTESNTFLLIHEISHALLP